MQASPQPKNQKDTARKGPMRVVPQEQCFVDRRPQAVTQCNLAETVNNSSSVLQQRALSEIIHNGPGMLVQRQKINALCGPAAQRSDEINSGVAAEQASNTSDNRTAGLHDYALIESPLNNSAAGKVAQMMKRSTRTIGLSDLTNANNDTQNFAHGNETRNVRIGLLRHYLNIDNIYNLRETILEDIGGNSKGHQHISGNPSLMNILGQVCNLLGISVESILNISDSSEDEDSNSPRDEGGDSDEDGNVGGTNISPTSISVE